MLYMLIVLFMAMAMVVAFACWLKRSIAADVIVKLQHLVEKMKEYDLDTRAGLIICRGSQLHVHYIDACLQRTLGHPSQVGDLLPTEMRQKHSRLVMNISRERELPESLNHPLRNVPVVDKDGKMITVKLVVGILGNHLFQPLYYVIIQPDSRSSTFGPRSLSSHRSSMPSKVSRSRTPKKFATLNSFFQEDISMVHNESPPHAREQMKLQWTDPAEIHSRTIPSSSTDINHKLKVGTGGDEEDADIILLPESSTVDLEACASAERYERATVLCMDIVGYTGQCAALGLDELSEWMSRIHAAIDVLLAHHAVRRIETRGDCIVCLTGTGTVTAAPSGSPDDMEGVCDAAGDQAKRMLAFARELCVALLAVNGTAARVGMATGPVVLAQVAHGGDARPAQYVYGGAAELAGRLEQAGRAGTVHLGACAARAYAAEVEGAVPPLHRVQGRGGGDEAELVAVYDCAGGRFLESD